MLGAIETNACSMDWTAFTSSGPISLAILIFSASPVAPKTMNSLLTAFAPLATSSESFKPRSFIRSLNSSPVLAIVANVVTSSAPLSPATAVATFALNTGSSILAICLNSDSNAALGLSAACFALIPNSWKSLPSSLLPSAASPNFSFTALSPEVNLSRLLPDCSARILYLVSSLTAKPVLLDISVNFAPNSPPSRARLTIFDVTAAITPIVIAPTAATAPKAKPTAPPADKLDTLRLTIDVASILATSPSIPNDSMISDETASIDSFRIPFEAFTFLLVSSCVRASSVPAFLASLLTPRNCSRNADIAPLANPAENSLAL